MKSVLKFISENFEKLAYCQLRLFFFLFFFKCGTNLLAHFQQTKLGRKITINQINEEKSKLNVQEKSQQGLQKNKKR